jgi:hypothetical protein
MLTGLLVFLAPFPVAFLQVPYQAGRIASTGFYLGGVAAFIMGIMGLRQIKKRKQKGKGFAITGIAIGALYVLSIVAWIVLLMVLGKQ